MKRFFLVFTCLSLFGSAIIAQDIQSRIFYGYADVLILTGDITVNDKPEKNFKAELFLESYRVAEKDCKNNFSFNLKRNSHYTLKISKEGHLSRSISISTLIPEFLEEEDKRIFTYEVTIELPEITGEENEFYTDFPIALIYYDAGIGTFVYNKKYTTHIKEQIVTPEGTPRDTVKLNYNYVPKSLEEAEKLLEEDDGAIPVPEESSETQEGEATKEDE